MLIAEEQDTSGEAEIGEDAHGRGWLVLPLRRSEPVSILPLTLHEVIEVINRVELAS